MDRKVSDNSSVLINDLNLVDENKSVQHNLDSSNNDINSVPNNDDLELLDRYNKLLDIAKKRSARIKQLENTVVKLRSETEKQSKTTLSESNLLDNDLQKQEKLKHFLKNIRSNLKLIAVFLIIFLPSLFVLIYTIFFYDNMYISSSTFTIKSNSNEKSVEMSSRLSFLGVGDNMDLNTASAYIQSLDMFYNIDRKLHLIDHYSSHDLVSSMPHKPTQSDIEDYWTDVIEVNIDLESALMQLQVRAYSPDFSQKLSQAILDELDSFINTMNQKMTQDSIKLANIEVEKAKKDIEDISEKIRKFRDHNTFIDPSSEASNILSIINNLENIITQSKAELAQKRAYLREDSVDIISLKNKISSLEKEVSSLRSRIAQGNSAVVDKEAGAFANVLTRTLSEFEQLNLEYQFAQKVLESALNNLETTRQLSLNKSKYLVTIDNPKIPDESLWPRPFVASIVTLMVSIFSLSAASLLVAAIRDHLGI